MYEMSRYFRHDQLQIGLLAAPKTTPIVDIGVNDSDPFLMGMERIANEIHRRYSDI